MFAKVKVDERNVTRVKYYPPKYKHETDEYGNEYVTDKIYAEGVWKARLEDGTVTAIADSFVDEQFGQKFVNECMKLGNRKFVPIPVGSCRASVMNIMPELRCKHAPQVKFMQGDIDSCVSSSLASAFYQTSIPDLLIAAKHLKDMSNGLAGGASCLNASIRIVGKYVKWLQPQHVKKDFQWEKDMNNYMFLVGVIKDSTGSCQHAVTIFRNWIFDSNEPYALPLCKESLDVCTWSVKDGKVEDASMFVCFVDGYILQEHECKKKKVLDLCANYASLQKQLRY
jgi:hypothetical protein